VKGRLGRGLAAVMLTVLPAALFYLVAEGLYALSHGRSPSLSLGYQGVALVKETFADRAPLHPGDPNAVPLRDAGEIEALLASFRADAVGLGNTPYEELKTEEASIHLEVDGCKRQKPNMRFSQIQLFTTLFEPLDPVVAFWDSGRTLNPEVAAFIRRYGFREVHLTTNRFGDRMTLPEVTREAKVIVGGDSVANGVMLNDDETLASQLQARDPARQYINTGVNGASAADVICAIEAAVRNYGDRIDELIYVYCENDFETGQPYGEPEQVVDWIAGFAQRHAVGKVTVVYAPYFYNVLPQLSRFKGYRGYFFPRHGDERHRLAEAAKSAGFGYLDYSEIALEESREAGTLFAAYALFVDHTHYSRYGTRRLADRLTAE